MKISLLAFVVAIILFSSVAAADHTEYCRAEVRGLLVEQNVSSGQQDVFCTNNQMKVKAVVSMTGLLQMPAELKLYNDGELIEAQTAYASGNSYVVSFNNQIPTPVRPKDPQINVTVSAGCDPTPDSMAINYTVDDCLFPSQDFYAHMFGKTQFCSSSYTQDFRCYGNWLQRLRQNEDCSQTWTDWKYCKYSCSDVQCLQKPSDEELQKMEDDQEKRTETAEQELSGMSPAGFYFLAFLLVSILVLSPIYIKLKSKIRRKHAPESF